MAGRRPVSNRGSRTRNIISQIGKPKAKPGKVVTPRKTGRKK